MHFLGLILEAGRREEEVAGVRSDGQRERQKERKKKRKMKVEEEEKEWKKQLKEGDMKEREVQEVNDQMLLGVQWESKLLEEMVRKKEKQQEAVEKEGRERKEEEERKLKMLQISNQDAK